MISGFRREVAENCTRLGNYAASSGNFLPASGFMNPEAGKKLPIGCPETSVRNYHYSPRNYPEERSSQPYIVYNECYYTDDWKEQFLTF